MSWSEARSLNPSSNTERTTRSSSTGDLINGNAGRPRISSASSPISIRQGAASIAARRALTPFEPPTVIVLQIGVSKAVGAVCACSAAKNGAELEGGSTHRGDCPAAWPLSKATVQSIRRQPTRRHIDEHSTAGPLILGHRPAIIVPSYRPHPCDQSHNCRIIFWRKDDVRLVTLSEKEDPAEEASRRGDVAKCLD
jgi:hypothetical protein